MHREAAGRSQRSMKCHSRSKSAMLAVTMSRIPLLTYDEVNANKLLERLQGDTGESAFAHVASEALDVGRSSKRFLILVVGLDLFQFGKDMRAVRRKASEEDKRLERLCVLADLDKIARRFG